MSAARRRQRSGLRGVTRLRRTLRKVEPELTRELRGDVEAVAQQILAAQQQLVPVRSGKLRKALRYRMGRDRLTARIGLITKKKQSDFFYARFLEFGTKGHPPRNIPPMPAQPFLNPAFDLHRDQFVARVNESMRQTLQRITSAPRSAND